MKIESPRKRKSRVRKEKGDPSLGWQTEREERWRNFLIWFEKRFKLERIQEFLHSVSFFLSLSSFWLIVSNHCILYYQITSCCCLIMASPGNPKQQQQGGGGIIAGGGGFDLNKLFKPSSSNHMNMTQPYIQQEQQQQQQGHSPSTNSNNDVVSLLYIYI